MIFTVLSIWIAALVVILNDNRTESTIWLSAFLFTVGLGGFSVVIVENYFVINYTIADSMMSKIYFYNALASVISHNLSPYFALLYGMSYISISRNYKKVIYGLLLIPPILSFILIPLKSSYLKTTEEIILYFRIIGIWIIPYMTFSIVLLIYSYLKEKSRLMKTYKVLNIIIIVPSMLYIIFFNIIFRALGVDDNWRCCDLIVPILFFSFIFFAYKNGALGVRFKFDKYNFAFENIIDFISDSFVVLDKELYIVKTNSLFRKNFMTDEESKYRDFYELLRNSKIFDYKEKIVDIIYKSENETKSMKISLNSENCIKYFEIQANPVKIKKEFFGTMLLFKDITTHEKNLELIKENQIQLIEKERLRSLSQLIGGVAHNLKTPLMSIGGGNAIIKRNIEKIHKYAKENCSDMEYNYLEHLINEINHWQNRNKEYLIYMTDIMNAIKGQLDENHEKSNNLSFTVKEVLEKITLLMAFEVKSHKCDLVKDINIDDLTKINGKINSLIQVLNNIINNAIEASEEKKLIILKVYKEDNSIIFSVKNLGEKIPNEIQEKLFKNMVTTKGKDGTGLGLYISQSIIKGSFNGKIYFNSTDNGTTFYINIPIA
ncbi:HAMP domain-containing histidine kinase [Clostridium sp. SHJSY1]|uniref:ATP-binding protein n=1 Tax=Clostridium sp. SHJSY1 TaxID=2942483 RepID=UPI0028744768|nr:ATP-binding protein [Clostridium sp. SHJSY1]MDS0526330.1 HAMP domain-containing histidine kinase [Clostridium sp. SHJSY1]